MKALIWNIRSVRTQNAFQRVQMLHNFHKFNFVALMDPLHVRELNRYNRRLKMSKGYAKSNGKIWLFVNHGFDVTEVRNSEQQLSILIKNQTSNLIIWVTIVYAKCDTTQRIELWEELSQIVDGLDHPWIIRGNFNVVLNGDEKIDGLPVMGHEIEDFQNCI